MQPRSWASCAALALAVALSGCAASDTGVGPDSRLSVYVSVPLRGPAASAGFDVVRGAKLALSDAGGSAGGVGVRGVYLDDTSGGGDLARWSAARASANARTAAEDSTAIAYLGDFDSGATRGSLPITNQAHMLQVSPASTAVDLVAPFLGSGQLPEAVQPSGERTFGRVIPADDAQAAAAAAWAEDLGAHRIATTSGGSAFGRTMVAAFAESLTRASVVHGDADLLFYGGGAEALPPAPSASSHIYGVLMASDALLPPYGDGVGGAEVLATSAAQDPSGLPVEGRQFVDAYQRRFGLTPGRYAAYGYEAMSVILDSIDRAEGSGADRETVIDAFFSTTDRHSVLGDYSIDDLGNTTLDRFAGYRIGSGGDVSFVRSLPAQP